MTGSHAPLVNFDTATMTSTMPVASEPTALITIDRFQPGSCSRRWCCTMPHWERVKAVKTPTA